MKSFYILRKLEKVVELRKEKIPKKTKLNVSKEEKTACLHCSQLKCEVRSLCVDGVYATLDREPN